MNIVFKCVDPGRARGPLEGSVHFCGILYLFEIPSVCSCKIHMQVGIETLFYPFHFHRALQPKWPSPYVGEMKH